MVLIKSDSKLSEFSCSSSKFLTQKRNNKDFYRIRPTEQCYIQHGEEEWLISFTISMKLGGVLFNWQSTIRKMANKISKKQRQQNNNNKKEIRKQKRTKWIRKSNQHNSTMCERALNIYVHS